MALKFRVIYSFQRDTTPRLATADDSVGGVKVSIVAFQAIDPGSIPGGRTFFTDFWSVLAMKALSYVSCLHAFVWSVK